MKKENLGMLTILSRQNGKLRNGLVDNSLSLCVLKEESLGMMTLLSRENDNLVK